MPNGPVAQPPKKSHAKLIIALIVSATVILCGCGVLGAALGGDPKPRAGRTTSPPFTATTTTGSQAAAVDAPVATTAPAMTNSQKQAVKKAKSYLEYTAFSRSGLIKQLKYEGFSEADATFAVDSLNVDWNVQAAAKAKSYLEFTSFSRSGLIKQLKYEGFTDAQAAHGVASVGL